MLAIIASHNKLWWHNKTLMRHSAFLHYTGIKYHTGTWHVTDIYWHVTDLYRHDTDLYRWRKRYRGPWWYPPGGRHSGTTAHWIWRWRICQTETQNATWWRHDIRFTHQWPFVSGNYRSQMHSYHKRPVWWFFFPNGRKATLKDMGKNKHVLLSEHSKQEQNASYVHGCTVCYTSTKYFRDCRQLHSLRPSEAHARQIIGVDNCLPVRCQAHAGVIKWKHFPRYWPFVRGIHRSPMNSPHKVQGRGAVMFSLICISINGWINNHEAGDLRRYRAHYDVIAMHHLNQCWLVLNYK